MLVMRSDWEYPEHLRPYEALDADLLEWAARVGEFDSVVVSAVADGLSNLVAPGPRWLSSAEGRGLVQRHDRDMASVRTYSLTEAGRARLAELKR